MYQTHAIVYIYNNNMPCPSFLSYNPILFLFLSSINKNTKKKVNLICLSIMAASPAVTELKVDDYVFPPTVKAPGSDKPFFLAGAGVRGLEIQGKFVKFTAIGVYLEECGIASLSTNWKGKTTIELANSIDFFRDIVTGPFEKFTQVTMILPLTGQQYSEKVTENCVAFWKAIGIYTDDEAKAVEKFLEVFKDEKFPPGHSIAFTQSPLGSLTIGFCKHDCIPESGNVVIENKNLSEAVIESIIGQHGVSPEAKQNLAARVAELLNKDEKVTKSSVPNGVTYGNNAEKIVGVPLPHDIRA